MSRTTVLVVVFALLVAPTLARAQQTGPLAAGPSLDLTRAPDDDLKQNLLALFDEWAAMFRGNEEVLQALSGSRGQLEALSAEQVEAAAPYFAGRVEDLRLLSRRAAAELQNSREVVFKSTPFPTAPYPVVPWNWGVAAFEQDDIAGEESGSGNDNCSIANSPTPAYLYFLQTIQTTVTAIAAIADRICNQFGSVILAGTNLSPLCIVTDIGAVIARAFNGNWNNCSNYIMAAEVTGTYNRLEHVHNDLVAAEAGLTTEINVNEVGIDDLDADLIVHDQHLTDRANAIDDQLDATAQFLVEFLDERLRLRIEAFLAASDNHAIAIFQLPASFDGLLELVREIVTAAVAAEGSAGPALLFLGAADDDFAAGDYKRAFENYGKAYRAAVGQ